jgi:hypothetical protein
VQRDILNLSGSVVCERWYDFQVTRRTLALISSMSPGHLLSTHLSGSSQRWWPRYGVCQSACFQRDVGSWRFL